MTGVPPWCEVELVFVQLFDVGVVQHAAHIAERVHCWVVAATRREDSIELSCVLLSQLQKDDWPFADDGVDNKGGQDHDKHRAKSKAEVACASGHISPGMLQEKSEHLATTKHIVDILFDLFRNVSGARCVTDCYLFLPFTYVRLCRGSRDRAPAIYRIVDVDIERLVPTLFVLRLLAFRATRGWHLKLVITVDRRSSCLLVPLILDAPASCCVSSILRVLPIWRILYLLVQIRRLIGHNYL